MKLLHIILMLLVLAPAFGQKKWTQLDKPTTRNLNKVVFIDTSRGWVVGDSGTVLHTTNGGASWLTQDPGISNDIHFLFMLNASYGWALAFQHPVDTMWYGTILLKTTNGGNAWSRQEFHNDFCYTVFFHDSVNGWLGGDRGLLMHTVDGGATWVPALVDSSIVSGFPIHNFKFYSRDFGFALGGHIDLAGVVWRTTNGGERWSVNAESSEPVHDLHFIDSVNLLAVGGEFDIGASVIRSKDAGRRWEYSYLGIWGDAKSVAFRTDREAWAPLGITGTLTHMVTYDTGATWTAFYSPDSSFMFDVTFADSNHGFMVGEKGSILKFNSSLVNVDDAPEHLPVIPTLYQNYPNPFNPATIISYQLPEKAFVTIALYDVSGRKVRRLFDGSQAAGVHSLQLNGENFASGVYFYELTVRGPTMNVTQVKKMLLLR